MTIATLNTTISRAYQSATQSAAQEERTGRKARVFRDSFESLQLGDSQDPTARAIGQAVAPLIDWADGENELELQVYKTALAVAAASVGGPAGTALAQNSTPELLSSLRGLSKDAGKASLPLLEAVVPQSWVEGTPTAPARDTEGQLQWALGQSIGLLSEDAPGALGKLWVVEDKIGQKVTAPEVEQAYQEEVDFIASYRNKGWLRAGGASPRELHGSQVAFKKRTEEGWAAFEGVMVASGGRSSALFQLEGSTEEFNSNDIRSVVSDFEGGMASYLDRTIENTPLPTNRALS